MKLNDIADNSENSINDREFYSQSYSITVMGYIIDEDSFKVVEEPEVKLLGVDADLSNKNTSTVEVVEEEDEEYIDVSVNSEVNKIKFTMDSDIRVRKIISDNINWFRLYVNDKQVELYLIDGVAYDYWMVDEWQNVVGDRNAYVNVRLKKGDEVKLTCIKMNRGNNLGKIRFLKSKKNENV
jgi:hypothetical protein